MNYDDQLIRCLILLHAVWFSPTTFILVVKGDLIVMFGGGDDDDDDDDDDDEEEEEEEEEEDHEDDSSIIWFSISSLIDRTESQFKVIRAT